MKAALVVLVLAVLFAGVCLAEGAKQNTVEVAVEGSAPEFIENVPSFTYRAYHFCVPFGVRAEGAPNLDMIIEVDTEGQNLSKGFSVIAAIDWDITVGTGVDTKAGRVLHDGENVLTVPLARFGEDPLGLSSAFTLVNTEESAQSFGPIISGFIYSNAPISNIRFTVTGSLFLVQYGECETCSTGWDFCGKCKEPESNRICLVPMVGCREGEVDICDESLPFDVQFGGQSEGEGEEGKSDALNQIFGTSEVSTILAWLGLIPVCLFVTAFTCVLAHHDRKRRASRQNSDSNGNNNDEEEDDCDVESAKNLEDQLDEMLLAPRDPKEIALYPDLADGDSLPLDASFIPVQLLDENGTPQIFYVSPSFFSDAE